MAPQDLPWGSTRIDVKKLHEHCVCGAFWKNLMLELQIPSGPAQLGLQELCHNGTTGMPGEEYFVGRISFHGAGPSEIGFALHGAGIIPSLKG